MTRHERRTRIYNFIVDYIEKNGFSPTMREIAKAVGLSSTSTVHKHVKNLRELGLIDAEDLKPRTIQPHRDINIVEISKDGKVTAMSAIVEILKNSGIDYKIVNNNLLVELEGINYEEFN